AGEMARDRLGEPGGAARADGDLDRAVAVALLALDLHDAAGQRLDDRHRHGFARIGEYTSHAALAADQTNGHDLCPLYTTPAAIGRCCVLLPGGVRHVAVRLPVGSPAPKKPWRRGDVPGALRGPKGAA